MAQWDNVLETHPAPRCSACVLNRINRTQLSQRTAMRQRRSARGTPKTFEGPCQSHNDLADASDGTDPCPAPQPLRWHFTKFRLCISLPRSLIITVCSETASCASKRRNGTRFSCPWADACLHGRHCRQSAPVHAPHSVDLAAFRILEHGKLLAL